MLQIVEVYPYKGFKERIRLTKELKGAITIEHNYIVCVTYEGDK